MNEEQARVLYASMLQMLQNLNDLKPNDRSDTDRAFAIAITDYQKWLAYVSYWICGPFTQNPVDMEANVSPPTILRTGPNELGGKK